MVGRILSIAKVAFHSYVTLWEGKPLKVVARDPFRLGSIFMGKLKQIQGGGLPSKLQIPRHSMYGAFTPKLPKCRLFGTSLASSTLFYLLVGLVQIPMILMSIYTPQN